MRFYHKSYLTGSPVENKTNANSLSVFFLSLLLVVGGEMSISWRQFLHSHFSDFTDNKCAPLYKMKKKKKAKMLQTAQLLEGER